MYIDFSKLKKAGFDYNYDEEGMRIYPQNPHSVAEAIEDLTGLRDRDVDEVCCLISDLQIIAAIKS